MREIIKFCLLCGLVLLHYVHETSSIPMQNVNDLGKMESRDDSHSLQASTASVLQPLLPLLAPSPSTPFPSWGLPKLSGRCTLNFIDAESLIRTTSTDCLSVFAPYLANVVCCPQLEALLVILLGQYSKQSKTLALSNAHASYCLSDIEQILATQGASDNLSRICSLQQSNLTKATCPVRDVDQFEVEIDSSSLLVACKNIDTVKECCAQTCGNAISEAATRIAVRSYDASTVYSPTPTGGLHLERVNDCKSIVLRWLASKLEPSSAKKVIRVLSGCNVNKVCPLVFSSSNNISKFCGKGMDNHTACCMALRKYMSFLQNQSFVTNIQALNCAALLGNKLQKENITENVFERCQITLKDFSVQAIVTEAFGVPSGCLFQSLPTDIIPGKSGVTFLCDLNDNIPAPWPSSFHLSSSSCNNSVKIPALPAVASAQSGVNENYILVLVFLPLLWLC